MADVAAVLEFLKKNGFKEAELALKEDVNERVELGTFDFEKFLFPVMPHPPPLRIPVRIPSSPRLLEFGDCSRSIPDDSNDEFVSLGSSTGDACSSDFTNPYGRHSASRSSSKVSSDRLSQFGTARDCPDFDLPNDVYWDDDKDEGNFMIPCFGGSDSLDKPSKDKFITISDSEKQYDNPFDFYHETKGIQSAPSPNYFYEKCISSVSRMEDVNEDPLTKYNYHSHEMIHQESGFEVQLEGCASYNCSTTLCKCYNGGADSVEYSYLDSTCKTDSSDSQFKFVGEVPNKISNSSSERGYIDDPTKGFIGFDDLNKNIVEKVNIPIKNDCYEVVMKREEKQEPSAREAVTIEGVADDDDLLMYKTHDDEYEIFNLRIIHRKNRTGFEENKDLSIILNTIIAGRYYVTEYLGSAAFSKVFQAHDLHTGANVCLKIIKNDKDFFDQSLDEIKLLKLVNKHDPGDEWHILRLYDFFYHQEHLFIVSELLRANLYEFLKFNQESGEEAYFTMPRLQKITCQCLEALNYLHHMGIIHCDLKPENILIKSYRRCEIKVIDLGSSCFQTDNLCLYVQSRSYRAPEVILGLPYDQKIDIWSLGCILAELCSGEVLFPNEAVIMILARMIATLGPIDLEMLVLGQETFKYFTKEYDLYHVNEETNQMEYIIPDESSLEERLQFCDVGFIEFVRYLLEFNPHRRPTAREALMHPWLSRSY